ncbi:hypothetical protein Tco_0822351 [Tanacetum coccineum]|uniref:Uncharacterized protein n=1 Tax=Tanacetum coccineum TaxID=301880 RepID=A0ABQ5AHY6_9ASTR
MWTNPMSRDSNVEYLRANLNIKGMSNSNPSLLRTVTDWKGKPSLRSTERSLLHDNIVPKPDLALELDPEPMQEDQTGSNSGKLHVSLAGPNPEHMDDEFLATAYPKVHGKNLKLSLTGAMCHRRKSEKSILVLHNSCTKSCKFLDEGDEWSDFRERCGDCLLASVLIGFHEPLGRFVARTSYQCAQGLVQAKRTCNFPEFDPVWFFLHGSRVGPDTILAWRVILLRLPKRSALKSNHVSSSLKAITPDSSATSVDLREGFPFQSVTVLSNEGSVHLILRTPSLYFKEQMPTDLTLRNEDIIGEACSLDLKIPWNS